MEKSTGIVLGVVGVATAAVVLGVRAERLKDGIQLVHKRPDIDFLKLFSNLKLELPITANMEIYNHSNVGVVIDSIEVINQFKVPGYDWVTLGTNQPNSNISVSAKSFQPLSIKLVSDLSVLGLSAIDIVKNKGKNQLRLLVTVRALGVSVTEPYIITV